MRSCGRESAGSRNDKRDERHGQAGAAGRVLPACLLLMAVEDEDGGVSMERLQKNAVECQRVGLKTVK